MTPTTDGLAALEAEMARQHADARTAMSAAVLLAQDIARSVRRTGRLILTGMGASHFGNRIAEAALRAAGIDATAIPTSELLASPLIPRHRTLLLVSQSGESGEIVAYLARAAAATEEFGLTLGPDSTLAGSRPSLVGPGGPEKAFAATRSLFVQLSLLAAICRALGVDPGAIDRSLDGPAETDLIEAVDRLAAAQAFVVSGRGLFQGLAEAGALALMELGRVPVLGLEGGQFRHGPLEILGPETGVVLLRAEDAFGDSVTSLAEKVVAAGAPAVVVDASRQPPIPGATDVRCPPGADLAAALGMVPLIQRLMIELAARRVPAVGIPVRSSKVTRDL